MQYSEASVKVGRVFEKGFQCIDRMDRMRL